MARSGRLAWIGGGRQLTDVTHVENTVDGLLLGASAGRGGEAYFVTDGEPVVFREFVSALLETQGVEAPTRSVPAAVAGPAATLAEAAWRVLSLRGEPPLTRFAFWISSQECTIDITKARTELGYEPAVTREHGLAAMRAEAGATA
jgi:nucleoside-diphosphate-sugar epimerase